MDILAKLVAWVVMFGLFEIAGYKVSMLQNPLNALIVIVAVCIVIAVYRRIAINNHIK